MTEPPREIVRRGYDTNQWVGGPRPGLEHVPAGRVLDLGCGSGEVARALVDRGCTVVGVDLSEVLLERARSLVPEATFDLADIAGWDAPASSFDAVVSYYAVIHLSRDEQQSLWPRVARWLRPGGVLVGTVGTDDWTGVDDFLGAPMWWDHPTADVTLGWLADAGFEVTHHELVPDGASTHTLVVAHLS